MFQPYMWLETEGQQQTVLHGRVESRIGGKMKARTTIDGNLAKCRSNIAWSLDLPGRKSNGEFFIFLFHLLFGGRQVMNCRRRLFVCLFVLRCSPLCSPLCARKAEQTFNNKTCTIQIWLRCKLISRHIHFEN